MHNNKKYYGGLFDNEEHAGMNVNLLCDKYKIGRKNPMIITQPDVIQQVTHSLCIVHKNLTLHSLFFIKESRVR